VVREVRLCQPNTETIESKDFWKEMRQLPELSNLERWWRWDVEVFNWKALRIAADTSFRETRAGARRTREQVDSDG
jgi:hypothetical protein